MRATTPSVAAAVAAAVLLGSPCAGDEFSDSAASETLYSWQDGDRQTVVSVRHTTATLSDVQEDRWRIETRQGDEYTVFSRWEPRKSRGTVRFTDETSAWWARLDSDMGTGNLGRADEFDFRAQREMVRRVREDLPTLRFEIDLASGPFGLAEGLVDGAGIYATLENELEEQLIGNNALAGLPSTVYPGIAWLRQISSYSEHDTWAPDLRAAESLMHVLWGALAAEQRKSIGAARLPDLKSLRLVTETTRW